LETKIENGDTLVIRVALEPPTPSATGKTMIVASSHGSQVTSVRIDGKPIYLNVNAYYRATPVPAHATGDQP
jgi:hypothetical protein